jgi:hypothetical protein
MWALKVPRSSASVISLVLGHDPSSTDKNAHPTRHERIAADEFVQVTREWDPRVT